jgi:predicted RNA-binding protein (virulence factor B family)
MAATPPGTIAMGAIGRYNTLVVTKHTDFGLYLDGGAEGEILLPRRQIPRDRPSGVGDPLTVFLYLDSEDRPIATTEKPKAQVGEFASLKVTDITPVGLFLDWGLRKDVLLPHSEVKRPLKVGDYCVVYLYLDDHSRRITATTHLDRHLDNSPADYAEGQRVDLLIAARTDIGYKAIINGRHWGLVHNNEVFKFLRAGMREPGYIKEIRPDGKISLSLQPQGSAARDGLQTLILAKLEEAGGELPLSDRSAPELIARQFGVSKGNFKKAIGALFKQGLILIHDDHISRT